MYCATFTLLCSIEEARPTIKDLNRYVVNNYATDWYDIGIELGLALNVLKTIGKDNLQQSADCLRGTLDKWLKINTDDITWKTLEIALTNVNRAKLGLNPVNAKLGLNDVYGKDVLLAVTMGVYGK